MRSTCALTKMLQTNASSVRSESFGQNHKITWIDRFGIWLSFRQVKRNLTKVCADRVADLGCGYRARLTPHLLALGFSQITLVDVALSEEVKSESRIRAIEGALPDICTKLADASQDAVLCLSVLEHVRDPQSLLKQIYRILAVDGLALINVPNWRGKFFLEFSAFRLELSPKAEMDDHKMYYDPRDLWPLLVAAGFKPSKVIVFKHKFGLNTFAICRK